MVVAEIELFKVLKTKFSEQEAEAIIAGFEQKVVSRFDERKNEFATKEDIGKLKEDIGKVELKIVETKAEIVKRMFIFWLGQFATFIAIAKFFFNK